jgi:hypothetical protein
MSEISLPSDIGKIIFLNEAEFHDIIDPLINQLQLDLVFESVDRDRRVWRDFDIPFPQINIDVVGGGVTVYIMKRVPPYPPPPSDGGAQVQVSTTTANNADMERMYYSADPALSAAQRESINEQTRRLGPHAWKYRTSQDPVRIQALSTIPNISVLAVAPSITSRLTMPWKKFTTMLRTRIKLF